MYIPPPAAYTNTTHITKRSVDNRYKTFSDRQLSRKVVQLLYVGCPRLMQIFCYIELLWDVYNYV